MSETNTFLQRHTVLVTHPFSVFVFKNPTYWPKNDTVTLPFVIAAVIALIVVIAVIAPVTVSLRKMPHRIITKVIQRSMYFEFRRSM